MKTITTELKEFLDLTGCTQKRLAQEARVFPAVLCRLLKGKQRNLNGSAQDRLRLAMARLASEYGVTLNFGPAGGCNAQKATTDD